eukprot:7661235-Pyramimonas_sp.AAC.1
MEPNLYEMISHPRAQSSSNAKKCARSTAAVHVGLERGQKILPRCGVAAYVRRCSDATDLGTGFEKSLRAARPMPRC